MARYTDEAEDGLGPATRLVDSRDAFPLFLSEDIGEVVARSVSRHHTDVGIHPGFVFDPPTGPEGGSGGENRLEGAGLDADEPPNVQIELLQSKAESAIVGSKSYAMSAHSKRQRQRRSVNAIDDLFQG